MKYLFPILLIVFSLNLNAQTTEIDRFKGDIDGIYTCYQVLNYITNNNFNGVYIRLAPEYKPNLDSLKEECKTISLNFPYEPNSFPCAFNCDDDSTTGNWLERSYFKKNKDGVEFVLQIFIKSENRHNLYYITEIQIRRNAKIEIRKSEIESILNSPEDVPPCPPPLFPPPPIYDKRKP